jgi:hypothetical protein
MLAECLIAKLFVTGALVNTNAVKVAALTAPVTPQHGSGSSNTM